MPRPPRIDYENAFHHVMNRGIARQPVFKHDADRRLFLECIEIACRETRVEVHCYCLMDNHFHLLVHSPDATLSKFLKHLSGRFTRLSNKQSGRDGPLFRGRAVSVLIDGDSQFVQTSKYIHLNPVEARLCPRPEDWEWSSAKPYLGHATGRVWLHTSTILNMFSSMAPGGDYSSFLLEAAKLEL